MRISKIFFTYYLKPVDSWLNVSNSSLIVVYEALYIYNKSWYGKKWSLFLEKVFWDIVKDLGIKGARFDVTEWHCNH